MLQSLTQYLFAFALNTISLDRQLWKVILYMGSPATPQNITYTKHLAVCCVMCVVWFVSRAIGHGYSSYIGHIDASMHELKARNHPDV